MGLRRKTLGPNFIVYAGLYQITVSALPITDKGYSYGMIGAWVERVVIHQTPIRVPFWDEHQSPNNMSKKFNISSPRTCNRGVAVFMGIIVLFVVTAIACTPPTPHPLSHNGLPAACLYLVFLMIDNDERTGMEGGTLWKSVVNPHGLVPVVGAVFTESSFKIYPKLKPMYNDVIIMEDIQQQAYVHSVMTRSMGILVPTGRPGVKHNYGSEAAFLKFTPEGQWELLILEHLSAIDSHKNYTIPGIQFQPICGGHIIFMSPARGPLTELLRHLLVHQGRETMIRGTTRRGMSPPKPRPAPSSARCMGKILDELCGRYWPAPDCDVMRRIARELMDEDPRKRPAMDDVVGKMADKEGCGNAEVEELHQKNSKGLGWDRMGHHRLSRCRSYMLGAADLASFSFAERDLLAISKGMTRNPTTHLSNANIRQTAKYAPKVLDATAQRTFPVLGISRNRRAAGHDKWVVKLAAQKPSESELPVTAKFRPVDKICAGSTGTNPMP
ncbi:hypothetical protein BD779DRAFT_1693580 [Infundibulicybe gibba]|nr:hypothetical protein BD779DRAFT_1693580 [Infundibulicybe gibba]